MDISLSLKKFGLEQAFNYMHKSPEKNFIKIMDWADKFAGNEFGPQRKMIREAITDVSHPYHSFVMRLLKMCIRDRTWTKSKLVLSALVISEQTLCIRL